MSPGRGGEVLRIYRFTMEYGQLLGTLNARDTTPPRQPNAWMVSGQQTGKDEAASEQTMVLV